MSHPLREPCKVVEFGYIFGVTAETKEGEFWDIRFEESDELKKFVREQIWGKPRSEMTIALIKGKTHAILTYRGMMRVITLHETDPFYKANEMTVKAIQHKRKQKKETAKLHEILAGFGIRFDINFCNYKEDHDYVTVYVNDKEVFTGTTEDLDQSKGGKS